MSKKGLETEFIDTGDNKAGKIIVGKRATRKKEKPLYIIKINHNHTPNVQFASLAHELGHLFLGHLGSDKALEIPKRSTLTSKQIELEAESVSYLICSRHGVESSSESYLTNFVGNYDSIDKLDIYRIMRAAGQIETLLNLGESTKFAPKKRQ